VPGPAPDLRACIANLPITLILSRPDEEIEEGDDEALLGLFVGPATPSPDDSDPLPSAIRLFVENLRTKLKTTPGVFGRVRTTLLHELGHYLGLDEEGLDKRGLS
jgi:predicted Zn-dependent protease with MMP-like domain